MTLAILFLYQDCRLRGKGGLGGGVVLRGDVDIAYKTAVARITGAGVQVCFSRYLLVRLGHVILLIANLPVYLWCLVGPLVPGLEA